MRSYLNPKGQWQRTGIEASKWPRNVVRRRQPAEADKAEARGHPKLRCEQLAAGLTKKRVCSKTHWVGSLGNICRETIQVLCSEDRPRPEVLTESGLCWGESMWREGNLQGWNRAARKYCTELQGQLGQQTWGQCRRDVDTRQTVARHKREAVLWDIKIRTIRTLGQ